jgi:hypothetical protein
MNEHSTLIIHRRLTAFYVALAVFVAAGMILSNLFISRYAWERVFLSAIEVAIAYSGLVLLLLRHTKRAMQLDGSAIGNTSQEDSKKQLWSRLISLPIEVFWIVMVYGIVVSQLLMVLELPFANHIPDLKMNAPLYLKRTIFNTSTFVGVGAIHYSLVLWTVWPFIRSLAVTRTERFRFRTVMRPMLVILCLAILFPVSRMFWYAFDSLRIGAELNGSVIILLLIMTLAIATAAFVLLVLSLFRDFNRVTESMLELTAYRRNGLPHRIPLISGYESGEVVSVFNKLQDRFEEHYSRMNRELELASHVQKRLLSNPLLQAKGWMFVGECVREREVGGGLYDTIQLDDGRLAMVTGFVSGVGLPSALVMSSVLALFRIHAPHASNPSDTIEAIRHSLTELLPKDMELHIGTGILDPEARTMQFANMGSVYVSMYHLLPNGLATAAIQDISEEITFLLGSERHMVLMHTIRLAGVRLPWGLGRSKLLQHCLEQGAIGLETTRSDRVCLMAEEGGGS